MVQGSRTLEHVLPKVVLGWWTLKDLEGVCFGFGEFREPWTVLFEGLVCNVRNCPLNTPKRS